MNPPAPADRDGKALVVSARQEDGALRVTASGELDISTVPSFNKELSELAEHPASKLILDLSAVTFMDSTGLSAVLVAEMHARMRGQRFVVVAGPPHVHELFRLTGVDNFLEVLGPEERDH
jgi:anti-sigma B factor antagonist